MKGNNTLQLNQLTMVAALQLWADATFKTPVRIVTVKRASTPYGVDTFEVDISEPDEVQP